MTQFTPALAHMVGGQHSQYASVMNEDRDNIIARFRVEMLRSIEDAIHLAALSANDENRYAATEDNRPVRTQLSQQQQVVLTELTLADHMEKLAREHLVYLADRAREMNCTWVEIGQSLGLSPHGAQQRITRSRPKPAIQPKTKPKGVPRV